jgi:8-oxo-dGTP pyrophosphatase MutT (NUDIX family)
MPAEGPATWSSLAGVPASASSRDHDHLVGLLRAYQPQGDDEAADEQRILALAESAADPWTRSIPLHITASALVVHPPSGRVLLRWHERQQAWLQVGGHADPGETDPLAVAIREGREETGLSDLTAWPDAVLRQVAVVPVPAKGDELAHEHADLRFLLATDTPDAVQPENPGAQLRWLSIADAVALTSEANLKVFLSRVQRLFSA